MSFALTPDEQFEILGAGWAGEEYAAEAAQRWGDTAAWRQSQARTAALTKQDWIAIKAETDSNQAAFAAAMHAGSPAGGERAAALAEQHRAVSAGSVTATTRRIAASARPPRPSLINYPPARSLPSPPAVDHHGTARHCPAAHPPARPPRPT
jgi:hypothetical protein